MQEIKQFRQSISWPVKMYMDTITKGKTKAKKFMNS